MTDPIDTVIAQCRVEGKLHALGHLELSGYTFTPEDWDRIAEALKINGGRPPSEKTEESHEYLARFRIAYRAQKRIEGRGADAMMRALRTVLPQFPEIPNDPRPDKPENINNPGSLARRIIGGKRPEITKLANLLESESKVLGIEIRGRNRSGKGAK